MSSRNKRRNLDCVYVEKERREAGLDIEQMTEREGRLRFVSIMGNCSAELILNSLDTRPALEP